MAFTVTATQSGSTANGVLLQVKVLTGADPLQTGGAFTHQDGAAAHQAAIVTTVTGSMVYGAGFDVDSISSTLAVNASTTALAFNTTLTGISGGTCRSTNPTGTPGSVTIGYTTPTNAGRIALLEVLPDGGGTITEDPSSPAGVSNASALTVTTASFNPPQGSLLVAMVASNGGAAVANMAITDTSKLGLVWVPGIYYHPSGAGVTGVWYAPVPEVPGIPLRFPEGGIDPLRRFFGPIAPFLRLPSSDLVTAATADASITGVAAAVTAASPAGVFEGDAPVTGTSAPVTVASPAGTPSSAVSITGVAAPVTVAAPAGVAAGSSPNANVTGVAAPVTVAAPAGTTAGNGGVTGTAAPVTVACPAGVLHSAAAVTGTAAPVTVASPAGVPSSAANITGAAAAVTVAAPAGVAFGSSPNANVTGTAAAVTAAAPAGVPHAAAAVTGISAPVTVAGGTGTASAPGAVTGTAAHITAAAPAGALAGGAGVTGTAAPVLAAAPAGALAAAANLAGLAALATVLGGQGTPLGGGATIKATSSPAVTALGTSTAAVTDPRDGTHAVTARGTSKPTIS